MLDRGIEDKISLFVWKFNLTFNVRRSSYPFVSGDTFRNVANYIFDSKKGVFLNNKIKVDNEAAIYFVEAHYINMFINN